MIHYRYGKSFMRENIKSEFTIKQIQSFKEADKELFNDHVENYGLKQVFYLKQYDTYDGKNGVVMTVVKVGEEEQGKELLINAVSEMLEKRIQEDTEIYHVVNGYGQNENRIHKTEFTYFEDVLAYYDEKTKMKATVIDIIHKEEQIKQYTNKEEDIKSISEFLQCNKEIYVVSYLFDGLQILSGESLEKWDGSLMVVANDEESEEMEEE